MERIPALNATQFPVQFYKNLVAALTIFHLSLTIAPGCSRSSDDMAAADVLPGQRLRVTDYVGSFSGGSTIL